MDDFHDVANEEEDLDASGSSYDSELGHRVSGRHSRRPTTANNGRFIPIEFAKQHIQKIEEDMKKMHERHVKLMREMDENYRLIE